MLSDSESSDSDNGIRFKTTSTRNVRKASSPARTGSASDSRSWRRDKDDYERNRDKDGVRGRHADRTDRDRHRDRDTERDRRGRSYDREYERSRGSYRDRDEHRDRERRSNPDKDRHSSKRSRSKERLKNNAYDKSKTEDTPSNSSSSGSKNTRAENSRNRSPLSETRSANLDIKTQRSISSESYSNSNDKSATKRKSSSVEILSHSNRINNPEYRDKGDEAKGSSKEKNVQLDEKTKVKKSKHKKHKHKSKREEKEKLIAERCSVSVDRSTISPLSEQVDQGDKTPIYQSYTDSITDSIELLGPALPPHMQISSQSEETYGPKLPSNSDKPETSQRMLGPVLPDHIDLNDAGEPQLDSIMSDISDDDDIIGPLPIGAGASEAQLELEKRALELKLAKLNEKEGLNDGREVSREEWMIELPSVRSVANLGLTARQFRKNERPDMSDRTSWTDTPKDRERKSQRSEPSTKEVMIARRRDEDATFRNNRDTEQEAMARKHKKKHKRDESLLEIHQKKMKKKKEKEAEKCERRPFNRETDLKVNRFDQAQKNAVLKKAQLLDTRFSRGEAKYL